jgi:hypothetical protein
MGDERGRAARRRRHDLLGGIPVEVRASPASQLIRVTLAAGDGNCGS